MCRIDKDKTAEDRQRFHKGLERDRKEVKEGKITDADADAREEARRLLRKTAPQRRAFIPDDTVRGGGSRNR